MALDVDKLIADAKAARAEAEVKKQAADKAAAKIKLSNDANRKSKLEADNKLNYANALSQSIQDFEGQLKVYATRIARDGKLDAISQKEFDRILVEYNKINKIYSKTVNDANKILASAPSPTKVEVKDGKATIASTKQAAGQTDVPGTPQQKPDDFAGLLKKSTKFIKDMSGPERKFLAQQLNDAIGANLVVSELVDPGSLLAAYNGAISAAKARYDQFQDIPTLVGFLNQKKLESAQIKAAGGSGVAEKPWGQIYDASQAKSAISGIITSLLGREATDKEITSITKKLVKAQADNPYKKNAKGMTVGGLNADQFITDLVKALPEYQTKKLAKEDLTAQDIAETARLNGFSLRPGELKSYSDRIKNGEDIKVIENEIRAIAGMGQPDSIKKMLASGTNLDTIYSPYKRVMASSLDLDPNAISLDDATLRGAIGPDKEMSLYDFKKAIRKDNRWKYSQEANDEVTEMISQVKRDFGFMG